MIKGTPNQKVAVYLCYAIALWLTVNGLVGVFSGEYIMLLVRLFAAYGWAFCVAKWVYKWLEPK